MLRILLFLFLSQFYLSQEILIYGKIEQIDFKCENYIFRELENLDSTALSTANFLLIFSSANSKLDDKSIDEIYAFILRGGRLYLGAENKPFNEECDQLLKRIFNLELYGNFDSENLCFDKKSKLNSSENLNAGYSTSAVPMDYRLKVEAWSNDNPIILSTRIGKGKLVIDGGYSRFSNEVQNNHFLEKIIQFLKED